MQWGLTWGLIVAWCAALAVFDIRERRLPNSLTVPAAIGATVAAAVLAAQGDWGPAVGAAGWFAGYVALFALGGVGGGDVKLAPTLGFLVAAHSGIVAVAVAIAAAQVITLGWAMLARSAVVPHGPPMILAALAAVAL